MPLSGHALRYRANAFEESLLFRGSFKRWAQLHADTDVELVLFGADGMNTQKLSAGDTMWFEVYRIAVRPTNTEVNGSFLIAAA